MSNKYPFLAWGIVLCLLLAALPLGCGGGRTSNTAGGQGTGRVQLTIAWPAKSTAPAASRYIPPYAQSLVFELLKKDDPAQKYALTVNRPDDKPATQTVAFSQELRVGTYVLFGSARTDRDGGGGTVALATTEVQVTLGETANARLALASTINRIEIVGKPLRVSVGSSLTLSGRALDPDGNVLFLPGGALRWSQITGGAFGTVTEAGVFTAVAVGTARVRLAEDGAAISDEADIEVFKPDSGGGLANSPWPKFHGNSRNTGLGGGGGAVGTKKWEFLTGNSVESSPAIGADGTVYVGSDDKKVYALDGATGAKKWEFLTGNSVGSSPAIGADGTVYVGSGDKKVYALDGATGAKKWEFLTGNSVYSSPAIGADGTVYIGSGNNKVNALDGATGAKKWEFLKGGSVYSSPAIGADGTVYIGSYDDKVYAIK